MLFGKHTIILAIMAVYGLELSAIPADPRPKQVRQPDGSMLTVVIKGDEWAHMTFSEDGVPLYYNKPAGMFEYARLDGGVLTGTGIAARNAAERSGADKDFVSRLDITAVKKAVAGNAQARRALSAPSRIRINDFPATGRQKSLVVLWEFSDTGFTSVDSPKNFYTGMLNYEGFTHSNGADGSARDFYLASSFGLFSPEFVVVGPVRLSHEASYYGSDAEGQDARIYEAIIESCEALDAEIDFSEYDADGDGYVDNVYFFYAGNGQADTPGGDDYIWPHSYYLESGFGQQLVLDGKHVDRYTCSNELRYEADGSLVPAGIGTFVHEFGHVLGLADHYDTSYNIFSFDPRMWDTMASGSYNNDMNTPPVFSAFERAELGWLEYTDLDIEADSFNILPNLAECNKAYRVKVPGDDNEFFVLENRQQSGWDAYLPGHGMLLWHIDMDENAWNGNYVNIDPLHQRVDIVEADGVGTDATLTGDPFPGTSAVTSHDIMSWDGSDLLELAHISEREDTVRLLLGGTSFTMQPPAGVMAVEVCDSSFCFTWSAVADATYYEVSVMALGDDGEYSALQGFDGMEVVAADTVTVSGLAPETVCRVEVVAGIAGYVSEPSVLEVETLPLDFEKARSAGLAADEISSTGFTASWDVLADADDYMVTLYKHGYGVDTELMGYGFSDKDNGLPEYWDTNNDIYYSVNGYYGESAPSLRLSVDGSYLTVAYPEAEIVRLDFWCRASVSGTRFLIEAYDGSEWLEVDKLDIPVEGTAMSVPFDSVAKARLVLERESGFVVIDDVYASCRMLEWTPVTGYDGLLTGGCTSVVFSELDPGATYGFVVAGISGGVQSRVSDEFVVTLPASSGISSLVTDGGSSEVVYDLLGRRMPDGALPRGIYIVCKDGRAVKRVVNR